MICNNLIKECVTVIISIVHSKAFWIPHTDIKKYEKKFVTVLFGNNPIKYETSLLHFSKIKIFQSKTDIF